jgi:hypothetical protein
MKRFLWIVLMVNSACLGPGITGGIGAPFPIPYYTPMGGWGVELDTTTQKPDSVYLFRNAREKMGRAGVRTRNKS